jgi:MarR family transcriptional regulator, organic hydroperoxide resistance regulator
VPNLQYPCLCALIRKAGRIATRNYDKFLKPSGLKVTQLSMLGNIVRNPGIAVSELGELLSMDQTTVSRNLRVLEKLGYIRIEGEMADQRLKKIQISELGVSKRNEALPLWEQAQLEMERVLGRENIEVMMKSFKKLQR